MKRILLSATFILASLNGLICQVNIDSIATYQCVEDVLDVLRQRHHYTDQTITVEKINNDSITIFPLSFLKIVAKTNGDSLFINYSNTDIYNQTEQITGKGRVLKDSIFIVYSHRLTGYDSGYITISGHKVPTGINELRNSTAIKCYPSIVKENFTLVGEIPLLATSVHVELVTMDGRVISSNPIVERGSLRRQFDMPLVRSGLYLLILRCDGRVNSCLKIMKR